MAGHPPQSADSPALCRVIKWTIRACGFNTGHCQVMKVPGWAQSFNVNAVSSATREPWTLMAATEKKAWIELARQCGFGLED